MKAYRYVQGLSIKNLATELNIDPATLSGIESGTTPTRNVWRKLFKFFGRDTSNIDLVYLKTDLYKINFLMESSPY